MKFIEILRKLFEGKKTIIGAFILLLGAFGAGDIVAAEEVEALVNAIATVFGFALTVYGRLVAKKPLI